MVHFWRGHSKKAVLVVALLVIATFSTCIVALPYIFPGEPRIRLNMRFVLQSNTTADVFITNCSWSAYSVEHDVYGTHVRWLEEYSELQVESEGPLTDAFIESGDVYISWNEFHFYGNDTWAFQVDLYVFGADVRIWIIGNESTTSMISTELRSSYSLHTHQDLSGLGIEAVNISTGISFFAKNALWSQASSWTYGTAHEYSDVEANVQNLFIGNLAVDDS
jgi:hypothetical protein